MTPQFPSYLNDWPKRVRNPVPLAKNVLGIDTCPKLAIRCEGTLPETFLRTFFLSQTFSLSSNGYHPVWLWFLKLQSSDSPRIHQTEGRGGLRNMQRKGTDAPFPHTEPVLHLDCVLFLKIINLIILKKKKGYRDQSYLENTGLKPVKQPGAVAHTCHPSYLGG